MEGQGENVQMSDDAQREVQPGEEQGEYDLRRQRSSRIQLELNEEYGDSEWQGLQIDAGEPSIRPSQHANAESVLESINLQLGLARDQQHNGQNQADEATRPPVTAQRAGEPNLDGSASVARSHATGPRYPGGCTDDGGSLIDLFAIQSTGDAIMLASPNPVLGGAWGQSLPVASAVTPNHGATPEIQVTPESTAADIDASIEAQMSPSVDKTGVAPNAPSSPSRSNVGNRGVPTTDSSQPVKSVSETRSVDKEPIGDIGTSDAPTDKIDIGINETAVPHIDASETNDLAKTGRLSLGGRTARASFQSTHTNGTISMLPKGDDDGVTQVSSDKGPGVSNRRAFNKGSYDVATALQKMEDKQKKFIPDDAYQSEMEARRAEAAAATLSSDRRRSSMYSSGVRDDLKSRDHKRRSRSLRRSISRRSSNRMSARDSLRPGTLRGLIPDDDDSSVSPDELPDHVPPGAFSIEANGQVINGRTMITRHPNGVTDESSAPGHASAVPEARSVDLDPTADEVVNMNASLDTASQQSEGRSDEGTADSGEQMDDIEYNARAALPNSATNGAVEVVVVSLPKPEQRADSVAFPFHDPRLSLDLTPAGVIAVRLAPSEDGMLGIASPEGSSIPARRKRLTILAALLGGAVVAFLAIAAGLHFSCDGDAGFFSCDDGGAKDIIAGSICESSLWIQLQGSQEDASAGVLSTMPAWNTMERPASCNDLANGDAKGFWTGFEGTGNSVRIISTPRPSARAAGAWMAVYRGECEDLTCMDVTRTPCGDSCALTIDTFQDERYLVLVGVDDDDEFEFSLEILELAGHTCDSAIPLDLTVGSSGRQSVLDAPSSDEAGGDEARFCGIEGQQRWFSFVGTGSRFEASACWVNGTSTNSIAGSSPSIDQDTIEASSEFSEDRLRRLTLVITTGSCGSSVCVEDTSEPERSPSTCGTGGASGGGSERTSWATVEGEIYYVVVLVRDDGGDQDSIDADSNIQPPSAFDITVQPMAPEGKPTCTESSPIFLPSSETQNAQENRFSVQSDVASCMTQGESAALVWTKGPGSWYDIDGTGAMMSASTCGTQLDVGVTVQVMSGTCGWDGLACVTDTFRQECPDDGRHSQVFWKTDVGEKYFIFVSSQTPQADQANQGGEDQTFRLAVRETEENTVCQTAIDLQQRFGLSTTQKLERAYTLSGSTRGAAFSAVKQEKCADASFVKSSGVWYTLVGNDQVLRVHTCTGNETDALADDGEHNVTDNLARGLDFDTQITVYIGDDCSSLVCKWGNDDACGQQSSLLWHAEESQRYHIYVNGGAVDEAGDFTLTLEPQDSIRTERNSFYSSDLQPLLVGSTVVSTTIGPKYRSFEDVIGLGDINSSPQTWFSLEGTGETIALSTCGKVTDFDTAIKIIQASGSAFQRVREGQQELPDCRYEVGPVELYVNQTRLQFPSEVGGHYRVLVHSSIRSGQGIFELAVSEMN